MRRPRLRTPFGVSIIAAAVPLAMLAGSGSAATLTSSGGKLEITASNKPDSIEILLAPNPVDPGSQAYAISDQRGIPDPLPSGCSRGFFYAYCPLSGISSIKIDLGGGNDSNIFRAGVTVPLTISGGGLNDTLNGASGDDLLSGGSGKDIENGRTGKDTLIGGGNNDRMFAGPGNDVLRGGAGDDTLNGGPGQHDLCIGGGGHDLLTNCELGD